MTPAGLSTPSEHRADEKDEQDESDENHGTKATPKDNADSFKGHGASRSLTDNLAMELSNANES